MTEDDEDESPPQPFDPLAMFEAQDRAKKNAKKREEAWQRTCKKLLKSPLGREFMRAAIDRFNLMGSVFTERMDPLEASRNDGRREVISDILNSAQAAKPQPQTPQ